MAYHTKINERRFSKTNIQATHTGFEPVFSAVTGQYPLQTGPMGQKVFLHLQSALRESNSPNLGGNQAPLPLGQGHTSLANSKSEMRYLKI